MSENHVVITGLGVVSSIGIGSDEFFASLLAKTSGIRSLAERTDGGAQPDPNASPTGIWIGGPVVDFDPKQYVRPRKALKVMCREIQLAFAASQLAVDGAAISESVPASAEGAFVPADIGTVFGSEMFYGPPHEMQDAIRGCLDDEGELDPSQFGGVAMRQVMPLWMLKYLPNMPACHVGIALNAHGPNNSIIMGDVSGPAAIVESVSCLQRGAAKLVVAGAVGTRINTTRINYRGDLPIGTVADPIAHSSRPHDSNSVGVIGGEGAASLVLECETESRKRGARPIARLRSYAMRFVPQQSTRGSSLAICSAIESALKNAQLTNRDVDLVVSHAMGDPEIDRQESESIAKSVPGKPLVAPMASLGHTGAASGQLGIAVGALAIEKHTIPPTLHAECSNVGMISEARSADVNNVLCLSHTSHGNAVAIVLQRCD